MNKDHVARGVFLGLVAALALASGAVLGAADAAGRRHVHARDRRGPPAPFGRRAAPDPGGRIQHGAGRRPGGRVPHAVSVASFYMDRYLVTQELYEKIMGVNPSKQKGKQNPVERIQWTDAARFCNKCSELDGLTPCYDPQTWDCRFEADGYRLPTEAEWEYACRAGSRSRYFFGDDAAKARQYAWFKPYSEGTTHPVGRKLPNAWGLHDMLGNVWEWCNDWYGEGYYQESPGRDPHGPATGKQRVLAGARGTARRRSVPRPAAGRSFPSLPTPASARTPTVFGGCEVAPLSFRCTQRRERGRGWGNSPPPLWNRSRG